MSVFKATPIAARFTGVAPRSVGGTQPDTGPYKFRIFEVTDGSTSESGALSHKLVLQVIDAPQNAANIGKKITAWMEPYQPGKTPAKIGRADGPEWVEGGAKAFMISVGFNPEKIASLKKDNFDFGAGIYIGKDGAPREGYLYYEAYQGEGSKSYTNFLDKAMYDDVVKGDSTIKLRNKPTAGAGASAGSSVGTGTSAADLEDDPLDDAPAAAPSGAGAGAAASDGAAELDELMG